jgi:hypothetical protein
VCVDGQLVITKKDLTKDAFTVKDECKQVSILTSDATITLQHDVAALSIEAADVTVDAQHVEHLAVFGKGATVSHTGAAPTVADTGIGTPTDLTVTQKQ